MAAGFFRAEAERLSSGDCVEAGSPQAATRTMNAPKDEPLLRMSRSFPTSGHFATRQKKSCVSRGGVPPGCADQIGRASCRERVESRGVAVTATITKEDL